jgi:6-phosphofructokinase 1
MVQLGEAEPGFNATLAGAVSEALNHGVIEEIYGAEGGLQGLMTETLIDLAEESQQVIRGLHYTPGIALGGGQGLPADPADYERMVDVLQAHNIRFLLLIGTAEAVEAGRAIDAKAKELSYRLSVIVVPVSGNNEIAATDHCVGFGTTAKTLARLVREVSIRANAEGAHDLVDIIEVEGSATGWAAASSTLARRRNQVEDPPHIVLMPESPFEAERFLTRIQQVLNACRHCVIVSSSQLVDMDGNYVTQVAAADPLASFAHGGIARILRGIIEQNLGGLRVRDYRYAPLQALTALGASGVDVSNAVLCGAKAVSSLVEGDSGKMVGLFRADTEQYQPETSLIELDEATGRLKTLPESWIGDDGMNVNYPFYKYAYPLIQEETEVPYENGLPKYIGLAGNRIERLLPA